MKSGYFSSDTQEFLRLLDKQEVKYLIVEGEAVIYYGYPRLTGDVHLSSVHHLERPHFTTKSLSALRI